MLTRFSHRSGRRQTRRHSWVMTLVTLLLVTPLLAACGGKNDSGTTSIEWQPGLPPVATQTAQQLPVDATAADTAQQSADSPTAIPSETPAPLPTTAPAVSMVAGRPLTDAELAQYRPNELGKIPVLEYHQFTDDESQVAQFVRTYDSFRADLQWLYDHDFYVVSMKSVIENAITAPAGKRPVVLTFDDSPVSQFRYLVNDDYTLTIDPDTIVGILEAFYAAHPDFGRGGMFGTLPSFCFNTGINGAEPDQTQYCGDKIRFLLDNGYEVENHTRNHTNIYDVDDDTFQSEIAGAIDDLQQYDPRVEANIFVVPNGDYPEREAHQQQREWMQYGFEWNGRSYKLIGSLMVGAEWSPSPVSVDWDSMWIPRIQMCDCTAQGGYGWDDMWRDIVAESPGMLYVSDGDPDTITIPEALTPDLDGTFDPEKAEGKQIIRY